MSRIMLLAVFVVAPSAKAQELAPPQLTTPPPWAPYSVVPGPSPEEIQALEEAGRARQRIGGALMAGGGTIAFVGMVLWIAGAWDCDDWSHHHQRNGQCGSSALSIAGSTTSLLGAAVLIPGIVVYSGGSRDVAQAREWKRCFWGPVSLKPTATPEGAGLALHAELM